MILKFKLAELYGRLIFDIKKESKSKEYIQSIWNIYINTKLMKIIYLFI